MPRSRLRPHAQALRFALSLLAVLALNVLFELILGGTAQAQTTWIPTKNLVVPRTGFTATLLANGRVLIAGGADANGTVLASAELYQPSSRTFFAASGSMTVARKGHAAVRLPNGKILITGGEGASGNTLASAELFDPVSGQFAAVSSMAVDRSRHTATFLPASGQVMIAGGERKIGGVSSGATDSVELFDGTSFTGAYIPMAVPRVRHTATLMANGTVLVFGGQSAAGLPAHGSFELWDQSGFRLGVFPEIGRSGHQAVATSNGLVMVTGGAPGIDAEWFDPFNGTSLVNAVAPIAPRSDAGAVALPSGRVLVVGGQAYEPPFLAAAASAEIWASFDVVGPEPPPFLVPASPAVGAVFESYPVATVLLNNGQVLVIGQGATMGLLYNPDPARGYVMTQFPAKLYAVDTASDAISDTGIDFGPYEGAFGVAVDAELDFPFSSSVYVVKPTSLEVARIDPATHSVTDTFTNSGAGIGDRGIAIGSLQCEGECHVAAVVNSGTSEVSLIDVNSHGVTSFPAEDSPVGVAVAKRRFIAVANAGDNSVTIVDFETNTADLVNVSGAAPFGVAAFDPVSGRDDIFVTQSGSDSVAVLQRLGSTYSQTATIPVGEGATGIALTPDGTKGYVANRDDGTVSVFYPRNPGQTPLTIPVGASPRSVAVTPDGKKVYVVNLVSQNISVIDRETDTVIRTIPVPGPGSQPIAFGKFIDAINAINSPPLFFQGSAGSQTVDLRLTGPTVTGAGSDFTYTVTVANPGANLTTAVASVALSLPTNVAFKRFDLATTGDFHGCDVGNLTCTVTAIPAGRSKSFGVVVRAAASGAAVATATLASFNSMASLATSVVTITGPTNATPVALPQTVRTTANAPVAIALAGTDAETTAANLTYTVVNGPTQGALSGSGQFLTYTPSASSADSFTFTVTDRGKPDGCITDTLDCAAPRTSAPATVTIDVGSFAVITGALAVPSIAVPAVGRSVAQALGDIRISESAAGALKTSGRIELKLPAGLSFASADDISTARVGTQAATGPAIVLPAVALTQAFDMVVDPASRRIDDARTFSFAIARASSAGPASLVISGILVVAQAGFVPAPAQSAPVIVSLAGNNPGLTATSAQNGTAVVESDVPSLDRISPSQVGQGATSVRIDVIGRNLGPQASVSFGPGILVRSFPAPAVDAERRTLTAFVDVDATASAAEPRDVTVTNNASGKSATLTAALRVGAAPSITGTDSVGADALRRNLKGQAVTITGANFQSPTTVPLRIAFTGAGITVVEVLYTSNTQVTAKVNVADTAPLGARGVTVTNPDGGLGSAVGVVEVVEPDPDHDPVDLAPSPTSPFIPPLPTISGVTPPSALLGATVTIAGTNFSTTAAENSVTFAGPNNTRISAQITGTASAGTLRVIVPTQAIPGPVTVAVRGLVSNALTFAVTGAEVASVVPAQAERGDTVDLFVTGSRFATGATVQLKKGTTAPTGVTLLTPKVIDATTVQVQVVLGSTATLGPLDVVVTNPTAAGGGSSTLPAAFEVLPKAAGRLDVALTGFAAVADYLPSAGGVTVTLDQSGKCTGKAIQPTAVPLEIRFTGDPGVVAPTSLLVTLASSAIPGTALNEDCELGANPAPDFSIGTADVASQQITLANPGDNVFRTTLYSYDWGGSVTVQATGTMRLATGASQPVTVSRVLPVDSDGDGLPDAYERNALLNADASGRNVLDFRNADQNASKTKDGGDRFAADGLSNFEKYRGPYLAGPANGGTGTMSGHIRLGAGMRHLFVRGRGFSNDPAVQAAPGTCGLNFQTGLPEPDATLSAANPCPQFQLGSAYAGVGIAVHDVTASFTASTVVPRRSLMNPAQAILDLATVTYDATSCSGTEDCNFSSKLGIRQWQPPTLGLSVIGSPNAYGASIRVFKRAVDAYFANKPYEHRTNDPRRVLTAPDGRAMLAFDVGDRNDNGIVDSGEATVGGQLAGDTYIPGDFTRQLNGMDTNNDGCVELPLVPDPSTLTQACNPAAPSASGPQATKQMVVRSVATHELGHAVGSGHVTVNANDIMYQYTVNWLRDGFFSPDAAAKLQIHNKGGLQ